MKYITHSMLLILAVCFSIQKISAQNPPQCPCNAEIVAISDCCAELRVQFDPNCPTFVDYRDIFISTTFNPAFPATISSWTADPAYSGISGRIGSGGTLLSLTSTSNLVTPASIAGPQTLGTICYESVDNGASVSTIAIVDNTNGVSCEGNIAETQLNCPPVGYWSKIYGNQGDNRPSKVKAFTDGLYVTGYQDINGSIYPTISKFNTQNGALIWHKRLDFPGRIADFEYDPVNDHLIIVGAEGPSTAGAGIVASDRSFIIKIDDFGNPNTPRLYDHPGREGFTRIIRHPNPQNAAFPYYVLGRKNPASNAPSSFDLSMVYNVDAGLNVNWAYHYDAGVEIEAYRLLIPLNDGNLFIGGNGSSFGSTSNEGLLVEINGSNGQIAGQIAYPGRLDLYDGVDMNNGEVAVAGHDFGADMGVVYIIDRTTYSVTSGFRFPDVSLFTEIGIDGLGGDLYTLGQKKAGSDNYPVVHRLSYINGIAGFALGAVYYKYLFDGETAFNEPHLSVTGTHDAVFYADARRDNPSGFGDYDLLVGSFDLDLTNDCTEDFPQIEQAYSINDFTFPLTAVRMTPPVPFLQYTTLDLDYACADFCSPPPCTADFSWMTECCDVQFTGTATGIAPFTYEWDIDCDDPTAPDITGSLASWSFPAPGTYQVCLKITDATGCSASSTQSITVTDNPPTLSCPPDITIPTDPGVCVATHIPTEPIFDDDCTDRFVISCSMSGATAGQVTDTLVLNKGVTTINCRTEDSKGQFADCSYTITVQDQEPPLISCPPAVRINVPACDRGSIATFAAPTVSDNCPMVTFSGTHQSGDFFSCGTTTVTYTATDMAGNQSMCSFPVIVNCQCAEIAQKEIDCTDVDDQFAFSIDVNDLTGSSTNNCTLSVSSNQSGVSISNTSVTGTGPGYTISGLIDIAAPPVPTTINLIITVSCVCPDGSPYTCDIPVQLNTPCCKEISVEDQNVCKSGGTVQIPLQGCSNLYDVQQVRWYIADAPCPPGSWGPAFQVTNGCAPLSLSPKFHSGDVCVYAEVDMGPQAGPCRTLTSNTATIHLCEPIGCSLSDQAYCYTGTPITPTPLSIDTTGIDQDCFIGIQWYDANGPIPGATGIMYQPPALSFTAAPTDCAQSFVYTAVISSVCGDQSCSSTIRLDNDDAPVGKLELLPPDVNPLCYGEDAVIEYTPECAGDPERWNWFLRPDGGTYSPLTTNGDRNPLYFTNRLYQDTWIKVEKQNGSCAIDEVELLLDIIDPLTINNFTADHSPVCSPTAIDMEVDFSPSPAPAGCSYTVYWYKGGQILHTSTHTSTTATYSYTPSGTDGLSGNFYCIIESSCCPQRVKSPVVTIAPPMEVLVAGPCFRCNCDTITLQGIVLYPIQGFNCTYQWYENGVAIPGETGTTLTIDPAQDGPFTFEVSCTDGSTTCTQDATYTLLQCGSKSACIVNVNDIPRIPARVYPNPVSEQLTIQLDQPTSFELLEVFDLSGKRVLVQQGQEAAEQFSLDMSHLPDGAYLLRAYSTKGELLIENLIKQ